MVEPKKKKLLESTRNRETTEKNLPLAGNGIMNRNMHFSTSFQMNESTFSLLTHVPACKFEEGEICKQTFFRRKKIKSVE